MIYIPDLRTARFNVEIHEMYLMDSVKLLNMPQHLEHKQTTFAVKSMLGEFSRVQGKESIQDPRFWTLQERTFAITNYIAGVQDENPNFAVGDLNFTDYLHGDKQYSKALVDLGEYEGDHWEGQHLLGCMLETIEILEGQIEGLESNRLHWIIGCMACQLIPNGQSIDFHDPNHEKEVLERMITISRFSESDFGQLYMMLQKTHDELMHLFEFTITDSGIVSVSNEVEKEGGTVQQYARFPSNRIVGRLARVLSKGTQEPDS